MSVVKENDIRDFFAKLLHYPRLIDIAVNSVELNDFSSRDIWKSIYTAILKLHEINVQCIFPNVEYKLKELNNERTYGLCIGILRNVVAKSTNVLPYDLEEVAFKELCARIVSYNVVDSLNTEITQLENPDVDKDLPIEKRLDIFNKVVDSVATRLSKIRDININYKLEKLEDVVNDYDSFLQEYVANDYGKGYGYGIPEIDRLMKSGLKSGNLDIIAGLTGIGKSWFGIHTAAHCLKRGIGGLYFSLEMTKDETRTRLMQNITLACAPNQSGSVANITDINNFKIFQEVIQESTRSGAPFDIVSYQAGTASVTDIDNGIKDYYTRYGVYPKVVIVDGIPNIKNESKNNPTLGEKYIIQGLDAICKEYGIAILATHQLNRSAYSEISLSGSAISGSLDIVRASSLVMSIQTHPVGKYQHLHKIGFMKSRHDTVPDGHVMFITDKQIGQFYVYGSDMYCDGVKSHVPTSKGAKQKQRRDEF